MNSPSTAEALLVVIHIGVQAVSLQSCDAAQYGSNGKMFRLGLGNIPGKKGDIS